MATNHLLRQADERRARDSNALAATAVAYEVAQTYQQRVQVLRDVAGRPSVAAGLAGDRSLLEGSLQAALEDGAYCRLELRSPGIDPVIASAPGACWSPPAPVVGRSGTSPLGVGVVGSAAFSGLDLSGAVPGHPSATLQAVFAVSSLGQSMLPGAGTHTTVVAGTTIVSSNTPAAVGQTLPSPVARAMVRAGRPASATIYSKLIHTDVIFAYQPVPGTGLGVFFSVTTKVAYASAAHVSRILFYGYLGVVAIGLLLAALVVVMLRRRERALRASEERLRLAFENAPIGKALIGLDGRYLEVNLALSTITGYTPAELRELCVDDLTHPDDRAQNAAAMSGLVRADQTSYTIEKRYLNAAGVPVWVAESASLVRNGDGSPIHFIVQVHDISERRRHEAALRESEERFRLAFEHAPIGKALIGPDGRYQQVNQAMCDITGYCEEQLLGVPEADITHPDDHAADAANMARMLAGEAAAPAVEKRFLTAAGDIAWVAHSTSLVRREDGSPLHFIAQFQDITGRKRTQEALLHQSLHDPLTGLANRTLLYDRIEHALAASSRSHTPLGVLYIDLDGFKQVNDRAGHAAGDQLLVEVAERLRRVVRPGDTVSRIGGDEYAVVCVDIADLNSLCVVATRVLNSLRAPFQLTAGTHHISASIGLAVSDASSSPEQLLSDADAGMYGAKEAGKDRIATPRAEDQARAARTARLLPELRDALAHGELIMYGQPVVDLATGATVAVETLIRWNHPVRGVLPPSEFLDVAEHSPLMVAVGQRALHESCRLAAGWSEQFGSAAPDVHVNVSGRQLESGHFIADVVAALSTHSLAASRLVLELTETHMPAVTSALVADLNALRDRGVRIAIDDLGTGYSTLARITELPVDILKIDLRFTAGLGRDPACDAVVRAVLNLGHAMDLSVVAEGVETAQQAELLRSHGCDTVQGYLYSRPRPEAELLQYLTEHTPTTPTSAEPQHHTIQFYDHDHELVPTVSGYLAAALHANEIAILVATKEHRAAIEAAMTTSGIDINDAKTRGDLVAVDAADTLAALMIGDHPDTGRFHTVIGGLIRAAAPNGRPVRAYAEMVTLLWEAGNLTAAIQLETLWNALARQYRFSLHCAYPLQTNHNNNPATQAAT